MRIANLDKNDFVNGEGVSVSLWTQGCTFRCRGCHNPNTWDPNGGYEVDINDLIKEILEAINANGIMRNFSVLGGEPLTWYNRINVYTILQAVKEAYPDIKTYLWTGRVYENIQPEILKYVDVLIDGQYDKDKRDVTLKMRGSTNQRVIDIPKTLESKQVVLYCQ